MQDVAIVLFIAQMLLCISLSAKFVGLEDNTGAVSEVKAYDKRFEEMVIDAIEIMQRFVVVDVDFKKVACFSI